MKRKEILEAIKKAGEMKFAALQELFEADNKNKRKRLRIVLDEYNTKGVIHYSRDTGDISWSGAVEPAEEEQERKHEQKKPKKRELFGKSVIAPRPVKDAADDFPRVVEKYHIRAEFPRAVFAEAERIPSEIPVSELARRVDMRDSMVVTIDGIDAKDLDDAVSLEVRADGWRLGVHIADVSNYVPADSKLDSEALKRGNSYYFINKVVPMFPEVLSNGLCSLNPFEDKLTMSAFIDLSREGEVLSYDVKESVIRTRYRLNYTDVQRYFDGELTPEDPELCETLDRMYELFQILYKKRIADGSIDFDFKEQKVSIDENGEPIKVWLKDRLDSERIVEEFMLAANKVIAKFLAGKGHSIFRIHEEPPNEKIADFVRLALRFGHKLNGVPVPTPQEIQQVLFDIKDKPYKEFLSQLLLRSMTQARYDTENLGHYGLGFEFYTHFTSPIRRYADLLVHRLIKDVLHHRKEHSYTAEELNDMARYISTTERVAMDAEREFYKIKSVRFMKDKEGRLYDGVITGVTAFGMFVQISEYGVEGLIRYFDIDDDYYVADEKEYTAQGRDKRNRYTIGDKVRVKVKRVNVEKGFLDFTLYDPDKAPAPGGITPKVNRGSRFRPGRRKP
ncbi:MAG: hypothetical protein A2Y33_15565 [Spirochaetes bacterium GWF1_51_8]|nr:MAG: hypothetical protein A2Y33_15565 [Spirochaetes bacterium GWF1_51_8]